MKPNETYKFEQIFNKTRTYFVFFFNLTKIARYRDVAVYADQHISFNYILYVNLRAIYRFFLSACISVRQFQPVSAFRNRKKLKMFAFAYKANACLYR